MNNKTENEEKKGGLKHFFGLGEVFGYFFRRKDKNRPANFNIRVMHGINRISIFIFLLAIIFLILRRLM